jgi:hypothetical protein
LPDALEKRIALLAATGNSGLGLGSFLAFVAGSAAVEALELLELEDSVVSVVGFLDLRFLIVVVAVAVVAVTITGAGTVATAWDKIVFRRSVSSLTCRVNRLTV